MSVDWQLHESGPADAEHTVLLLPGGMCHARSYVEVMAEPALADLRLVAVTLPGQAGAPPPEDYDPARYGADTAELAAKIDADVVVGFSMGATVALEMVASGAYRGPTVLLGLSLSAPDEPAFFRALIRLMRVFGTLPARLMRRGVAPMVKRIPVSAERQAELRDDFLRNDPHAMRGGLFAYLRWLHAPENHADRLCRAAVPTWVVHAEKGDGGLTAAERRTLEACPHVTLVTIPGSVFFLPNEVPGKIADVILEAVAAAR
jgi:pimeloyl-ACP methyl ester carboxylesterase